MNNQQNNQPDLFNNNNKIEKLLELSIESINYLLPRFLPNTDIKEHFHLEYLDSNDWTKEVMDEYNSNDEEDKPKPEEIALVIVSPNITRVVLEDDSIPEELYYFFKKPMDESDALYIVNSTIERGIRAENRKIIQNFKELFKDFVSKLK